MYQKLARTRPIKGFFVRDEAKDHGTKKLIDGYIEDGASVIIVDDVTTKGESALKAVRAVQARECRVVCVVSLVDRLAWTIHRLKLCEVGRRVATRA